MSQVLQKILITLGAVGLMLLGYFLFVNPSQFALQESAVNPLADSVLIKTQAFIARRAALDRVEITSELFSDTRFTGLRSYTTPLAEQDLGKRSIFDVPADLQTSQSE